MGNKQWKDAVRLIEALVAAGGCFTMENPQTSCLWWSREMDQLSRLTPCKLVTFTQCAYDLRPPAAQAYEYFPKITSVFGNLNDLHVLERRCPGKRPCHSHVAACGSRKVRGKHVSLAKATGRYPPKLCASLAKVVLISLQRGPSHVFRRFDSHSCGLFSSFVCAGRGGLDQFSQVRHLCGVAVVFFIVREFFVGGLWRSCSRKRLRHVVAYDVYA